MKFYLNEDVEEKSANEQVEEILRGVDFEISKTTIPNQLRANLTKIVIPYSIVCIGDEAFKNCASLMSLMIPDCVTDIGYQAFQNCTSLLQITIPDSVIKVGQGAFDNCTKLKYILCKSQEVYDELYVEYGNIVQQGFVKTPVSVVNKQANKLFKEAGEEISWDTIPSKIREHITQIIIPENVKLLGNMVFQDCESLESVEIENGVKDIGNYAFQNCASLSEIVIPSSVISIGKYAFSWCRHLRKINLPESIKVVGKGAFDNCANLTNITCKSKEVYDKLKSEYGDIVKKDFDDNSNENFRRKLYHK